MSTCLKTNWMERLGYAGLIPFLALAALTALCGDAAMAARLAEYNLLYGVAIVSFLGAVHWGLVVGLSVQENPACLAGVDQAKFETRSLIWGVTPALLAWLVGALVPTQLALWMLAFVLLLVWYFDRYLLKPMGVFERYLKLRNHLTLGAAIGLGLTASFT